MKARNLASPRETLRTDDPASEAARILSRHDVRAILVVDPSDEFAGVIRGERQGSGSGDPAW
jgi:CBS domain-containing protein